MVRNTLFGGIAFLIVSLLVVIAMVFCNLLGSINDIKYVLIGTSLLGAYNSYKYLASQPNLAQNPASK
jgi:hypothetical protein